MSHALPMFTELRFRVSDMEAADARLRAARSRLEVTDWLDDAAGRHSADGILSWDPLGDGTARLVWQRQWEGDLGTDWSCETEWPRAEAERLLARARELGLELEVVR